MCGGRPSRNQSQCDVEEEVKDKTDKGDMNNNETGEQVGGGGGGDYTT